MRGRRCAKAVPERKAATPQRLRGACAVSLVSSRPGGVGAPPGDTTIPRQELADVDVRSFRPVWTLALEWADTVRASVKEQTHDPRQARPDAVNLLPDCQTDVSTRGTAGQTPRWSAGRRAGLRYGPVIPEKGIGPTARRANGCARLSASASSGAPSPLAYSGVRKKEGHARRPPPKPSGGAFGWMTIAALRLNRPTCRPRSVRCRSANRARLEPARQTNSRAKLRRRARPQESSISCRPPVRSSFDLLAGEARRAAATPECDRENNFTEQEDNALLHEGTSG